VCEYEVFYESERSPFLRLYSLSRSSACWLSLIVIWGVIIPL